MHHNIRREYTISCHLGGKGQVIGAARFAHIGRCEIDGDAGVFDPAILECGKAAFGCMLW